MRFIKLTLDQAVELKEKMLGSEDYREISRYRAMMLSHKGYTINDLADIFDVDRDTITNWFDRYETQGISGLKDLPRSGRNPKLSDSQKKL
jgi:transposase